MALYGCSTHLERGTPPRHLAGYRKSLLAAHQNRGYSHFRFLVPAKICVSMDFPDCLAGLFFLFFFGFYKRANVFENEKSLWPVLVVVVAVVFNGCQATTTKNLANRSGLKQQQQKQQVWDGTHTHTQAHRLAKCK